MANVEAIARDGSPRLEAMHFGVADYAASNKARTVSIGGLNPDYPGDQWHAALSRMIVACRAYGLRPIDGPFGDFGDAEGYVGAARRAAALGAEGKWAIHPSQIALANEVFSPTEAETKRAERILAALAGGGKRRQRCGSAGRQDDRCGLGPHGREHHCHSQVDRRPRSRLIARRSVLIDSTL